MNKLPLSHKLVTDALNAKIAAVAINGYFLII
jgi:hypothetical protein